MIPYIDVQGKPFNKKVVRLAVICTLINKNAYPGFIARKLHIGYGMAMLIVRLMMDAGIISDTAQKPIKILFKNEEAAINAVMRQLKKGKA